MGPVDVIYMRGARNAETDAIPVAMCLPWNTQVVIEALERDDRAKRASKSELVFFSRSFTGTFDFNDPAGLTGFRVSLTQPEGA